MTRLEAEIHQDVTSVINEIKNIKDTGIELVIPRGAILFENILNLKLIRHMAEKNNMTVHFSTEDPYGLNLIEMMEDGGSSAPIEGGLKVESTSSKKFRLSFPSLPKLSLRIPRLPKISFVIVLAVLLLGVFGLLLFIKSSRVEAKLIVETLPLTRSVTVRVVKGATTDAEKKILKGAVLQATDEDSMEQATTGEKEVGEKATGEVTIYNKTVDDIKLKKGATLNYDDKNLEFTLNEEITIPARTEPAGGSAIWGEKTAKVAASAIGPTYNISKDKSLEIKGYKKSDLEAKSKATFSGGKSEKVKVVAEVDLTKLSDDLLIKNTANVAKTLENKGSSEQKYIKGSELVTITKKVFSNKVSDQVDKITLNQAVTATGLSYYKEDLNKLAEDLTKDLIPQGYILASKDREVAAEILGKSTNSTLTSEEADIQLTIKTFVIPNIDTEKLKEQLKGKTSSEAQKILGGISNIKTYEFKTIPNIPFLQKVPKDTKRINIVVENK